MAIRTVAIRTVAIRTVAIRGVGDVNRLRYRLCAASSAAAGATTRLRPAFFAA